MSWDELRHDGLKYDVRVEILILRFQEIKGGWHMVDRDNNAKVLRYNGWLTHGG